MRVCLIVPYYGILPKWLPLFFATVANNPSMDLFWVTSEPPTMALPTNVKWVELPMGEIERRVRERLSPQFRLNWAYKLCDLKPYYGIVFADLIQDYGFWGYCDYDLVFGDVERMLKPDRLAAVDFFSADAGLVVGTFNLYRNTPDINRLATRIPDFQIKLDAPDYQSLDEKEMLPLLESLAQVRRSIPRELSESQLSITADGEMVGRTEGVRGDPTSFYWRDGRTWVSSRGGSAQEVMYLHFIGLKRNYHWTSYDPLRSYDRFSFSAAGFRAWIEPPTMWQRVESGVAGAALRSVSHVRALVARSVSNDRRRQLKGLVATIERHLNR